MRSSRPLFEASSGEEGSVNSMSARRNLSGTMKKVLVIVGAAVAAVALLAWIISWFWADEAVATSAARVWPGGMGTLDAVADRFPPLPGNDASVKLTALAAALPKNEAVDD